MSDNESAWSRGWRDTKYGIGDWRFWVLEFFGGGMIAITWSAWAAIVAVAVMFGCLWVGATASAPKRQRDEARSCLKSLDADIKNALLTIPPNLQAVDASFRQKGEVVARTESAPSNPDSNTLKFPEIEVLPNFDNDQELQFQNFTLKFVSSNGVKRYELNGKQSEVMPDSIFQVVDIAPLWVKKQS